MFLTQHIKQAAGAAVLTAGLLAAGIAIPVPAQACAYNSGHHCPGEDNPPPKTRKKEAQSIWGTIRDTIAGCERECGSR